MIAVPSLLFPTVISLKYELKILIWNSYSPDLGWQEQRSKKIAQEQRISAIGEAGWPAVCW